MKYTWRSVNVGLWIETIRGTVTPPITWQPKTDFDYETRVERTEDEASLGVKADSQDSFITKIYGDGEVKSNVYVTWIGYWLYSLLGKETVTEVVTDVYDHLLQVNHLSESPSITLAVSEPNGDYAFPLWFITSFTLSVSREEASMSIALSSKAGIKQWSSYNPAYVQDYQLKPKNSLFKLADNLAGLSGVNPQCIKSFEITIERTSIEDYCLSQGEWVMDYLTGQYSITGSITATYNDEATFKIPAQSDIAKACSFELTDSQVNIGGGENPSIKFTLPKVKFIEFSRNISNGEIIEQTANFKAFYDATTGKYIDVNLVNNHPTYVQ